MSRKGVASARQMETEKWDRGDFGKSYRCSGGNREEKCCSKAHWYVISCFQGDSFIDMCIHILHENLSWKRESDGYPLCIPWGLTPTAVLNIFFCFSRINWVYKKLKVKNNTVKVGFEWKQTIVKSICLLTCNFCEAETLQFVFITRASLVKNYSPKDNKLT